MGADFIKNKVILYLRPHIAGRFEKHGVCQFAQNGAIWGFANWTKMEQFEFFSTISCTNSTLKGGHLKKKNPTPEFWAPCCGLFGTCGGLPICLE